MAVPISPFITWFTLWAPAKSHRTDLTSDHGWFWGSDSMVMFWHFIIFVSSIWLLITVNYTRIFGIQYSHIPHNNIHFPTKFSRWKKVCNSLIRVGPNKIGIGKLELFALITVTDVPKLIFIKILKEFYQKKLMVLLENKPTWFTSAISSALDPSFQKDKDILVLPLDLSQLDTHENLAKDVIKHFGKVK